VRLQPDFVGAHTTLAGVLRQTGDTAGADAEIKVAAEISKEKTGMQAATFAMNSGKKLLAAGDIDGAIAQFRSAIKLVPNSAQAHFQLGTALKRRGETGEGDHELKRAAELDPRLAAPGQ
jgi:Flp pilus assembly protein TadD